MITLKDIADKVGVSRAAVSSVLGKPSSSIRIGPKTRAAIEAAAKELGYRPNEVARSMVKGKTRTIALMTTSSLSRFSFSTIAVAILGKAEQNQYQIKMICGDWEKNASTIVDKCLGQRIEGAICQNLDPKHYDLVFGEFEKDKVPIVLVQSEPTHPWGTAIVADNFNGSLLATEYLISLGHRQIAHISLPSKLGMQRANGYQAAMKKAGLEIPEGYLEKGGQDGSEIELTEPAVYRLLNLHKQRPTAIFCGSDRLAMITSRIARKLGISIPGDLSLMGFSSTGLGQLADPPLTTIDHPFTELGELATHTLIKAMEGDWKEYSSHANTETVAARLMIRESTSTIRVH